MFARVVEAGSFSGAAQRLNVSKSVVSKHVADLERAIGAQLLVRTTRNITVTEAGREFYGRCAQMLDIAEQAELAASKLQSEPRGTLRIVVPVSFGVMQVARMLPAFLASHRKLCVELVLTNRPVNLVEEGFDASIVIRGELPPGMVARRLATVKQRLCAAPSYIDARGLPASPSGLRDHDCLVFANSASHRTWTFRSSDGSALSVPVTGTLQVNNYNALRVSACGGAGVVLLPDYVVDADIEEGCLVELLRGWKAPDTEINMVYPPGRNVAPKIRAFVDFLIAHFTPSDSGDRQPPAPPYACADGTVRAMDRTG
jgi:DNA-binding transcriptional LysR family regulator